MGGVIVVDAGRSRSTFLRHDAYIHDLCHESVIIICFSTNCPTVICLPTVCYVFEREASSENYGPRVYFIIYKKPKIYFLLFYFAIYFIYLSLSELILANNEFKGIDNPLARVGCKYLLLCVYVLLIFCLRGFLMIR